MKDKILNVLVVTMICQGAFVILGLASLSTYALLVSAGVLA